MFANKIKLELKSKVSLIFELSKASSKLIEKL